LKDWKFGTITNNRLSPKKKKKNESFDFLTKTSERPGRGDWVGGLGQLENLLYMAKNLFVSLFVTGAIE
jgi:hypothetical protein